MEREEKMNGARCGDCRWHVAADEDGPAYCMARDMYTFVDAGDAACGDYEGLWSKSRRAFLNSGSDGSDGIAEKSALVENQRLTTQR